MNGFSSKNSVYPLYGLNITKKRKKKSMGRSLGCDTCHRSGKTGIDLAKTGPYPKQTRMSTVATINRLPAFSPSGKIEARLRFKVCWALG